MPIVSKLILKMSQGTKLSLTNSVPWLQHKKIFCVPKFYPTVNQDKAHQKIVKIHIIFKILFNFLFPLCSIVPSLLLHLTNTAFFILIKFSVSHYYCNYYDYFSTSPVIVVKLILLLMICVHL